MEKLGPSKHAPEDEIDLTAQLWFDQERRVSSWFDQERRAPYKVRRGAEGFLADPCQLLIIPDAHRHRDDDDDDGDLANPCQILLILNAHYGDD